MVEPLKNPALVTAAQEMHPAKYVALVTQIDELPLPRKADHKCYLALVGQGLCRPDEVTCIESSMCVPIFPATEHPLSREPLRPKPAFPFPGCYQYSCNTSLVRIPNKPYLLTNAVSLSSDDMLVNDIYVSEDSTRRIALRNAKAGIVPAVDDSEDLRTSYSVTSSVGRELVRQGMPVVNVDDSENGSARSVGSRRTQDIQVTRHEGHGEVGGGTGDLNAKAMECVDEQPSVVKLIPGGPLLNDVPPQAAARDEMPHSAVKGCPANTSDGPTAASGSIVPCPITADINAGGLLLESSAFNDTVMQ
ncbi:hypothetical protein EVJ58_g10999 [Rhodofomes roseus]|uniref:Uncharacterized protein n=1 Tax=Rhodofomes roseus TaxID=34475 RepID=A0A4Y9XMJ8_9APHY|nr:hypothetical protein EVJ58_g10999 [Rhodofomes roseus]